MTPGDQRDQPPATPSAEEADTILADRAPTRPAAEAPDFYEENGFVVFTAAYLLRRGYCCGNGCRHCPYPESPNESPAP